MIQKNKTILLAEDDPGIIEVVKIILSDEGYDVTVASTKKEIEEVLKTLIPDLVLLDVLLSGDRGQDVATYIHSTEKTKDVPIVFLSANSQIEEIAKEAGAVSFLAKPFEIPDLLETVKKYS